MGLIEIKFQLQRQIQEAQALVGRLQQSVTAMSYYAGTEEPVSFSELEISIAHIHLAIISLQKQITILEQSEAYKKEYGERYAVYQEPLLEQATPK